MMYSPSILSNQDINEPDKSVLNSEVFSFQGLFVKYIHEQMWHLGQIEASCLWS